MHHSLSTSKTIPREIIRIGDAVNGWTFLEQPLKCAHKVLCRCVCGHEYRVKAENILRGLSRNCIACSARRTFTKHGASDSGGKWKAERIYRIWKAMKWRCNPKNTYDRKMYHSRGITVCESWLRDFVAFRDWAIANGYRADLTLDRIDNDKGYSPDNCRWATYREQAMNRTTNRMLTAFGETKHLTAWKVDPRNRVSPNAFHQRIFKGMPVEEALTTPPLRSNRRPPSCSPPEGPRASGRFCRSAGE